MRVALIHDWLTGVRGGERVLEALIYLFPDADLFTLLHVPGSVSPRIESRPIHTSFVQHLPQVRRRYRNWLPIFPVAIERFDFTGYDLLLSSSHCVAKGARPPAGAVHVCYCHTPMRYIWDQYDAYFGKGRAPAHVRLAMRAVAPRLRAWDRASSARVHAFVANSHHVAQRILRWYGRTADVVYPPVDVQRFAPAATREDYYLIVSALVPYKRIDIAIDAFRQSGRRLRIAGDGPEAVRLMRRATPNIEFTGQLADQEIADMLSRCRAVVLPGEEDFGIVAVEAQAAGAPVIAFGAGGALESVVADDSPQATGVFFQEPTAAALNAAVRRFEDRSFGTAALLASAARFSPARFYSGMRAVVARALDRTHLREASDACVSSR